MLESLLAPKGVVVVGASRNATKLGYGAARNLVVSGYTGAVNFVNPGGGELFGHPLLPDLASVPDPVDLAVVLVPATAVPQVLEDCGQRGVRAAIIGAGGFREKGPAGAELEAQCLAIAQRHGLRVLGPNSIGYLDTHLPIDTSFLPLPGPIPGDIAFLSHSGAICEAVIDWARGQGFGLSRLVSLGNQMDLTEGELLSASVQDPNTQVVAMYLEGVGDGRSFVEQAERAVQSKPVVAIKVGKSKRGGQAVASHTGALAGADAAYQAAFRRAGVLRAASSEEMFDWSRALAWCPLPAGRRVAILTNAGGPGAIAVDALDDVALEMADLQPHSRTALAELLPAEASTANPVDMLASAGPTEYAACLAVLLADPGVDSVMIILPPPPMTTAAEVVSALIPQAKVASKPIVVALMGEELIAHAAQLLRQAKVPDYRFPERAASALLALSRRAEQIGIEADVVVSVDGTNQETARNLLTQAAVGRDGFVAPQVASQVAACYGLPLPPEAVVRTVAQVLAAADELGYPLALKLASADLPHKADLGGIMLDLAKPAEVADAFDQVSRRGLEAGIDSADLALMLQPMARPGLELLVGARQDAQFGPLLVFGAGGAEVETLDDISVGLAPLGQREAQSLIDATRVGRRLTPGRGRPALDRQALIDCMHRLAWLASDLADLVDEVEINPLRVYPDGCLALDVRLRLAQPA